MIFSVSDKGGLEEKKFCPMYSPGLLKFAVTFRLLYGFTQFHKEPTSIPSHIQKIDK